MEDGEVENLWEDEERDLEALAQWIEEPGAGGVKSGSGRKLSTQISKLVMLVGVCRCLYKLVTKFLVC